MDELKNLKTIIKNNKGFELNQILFKIDKSSNFNIPDRFRKDYEMVERKWKEKERNNSFRNQENLCVTNYHIKDKKLFLNLSETKYLTRQIFSETISLLSDLEQDMLVADIMAQKTKIPLAYKACIGIITKDNKLLFMKRSSKVATNKGKIDFSLSKSAKPEDFEPKTSQPLMTILRALKEELNISLDFKELLKKEALTISEFFINRDIFSIGFLSMIDLRKMDEELTYDKIMNLSENAKNSWEFSEIFAIDFNKKSIGKFLKEKENREKLTNYSRYHLEKIYKDL